MKKEKWILEVLVGDKTYLFKYDTKGMVFLDVDALLFGVPGNWVHIQDSYFRAADIKMVDFYEIK